MKDWSEEIKKAQSQMNRSFGNIPNQPTTKVNKYEPAKSTKSYEGRNASKRTQSKMDGKRITANEIDTKEAGTVAEIDVFQDIKKDTGTKVIHEEVRKPNRSDDVIAKPVFHGNAPFN